jgi:hypothetical protein
MAFARAWFRAVGQAGILKKESCWNQGYKINCIKKDYGEWGENIGNIIAYDC